MTMTKSKKKCDTDKAIIVDGEDVLLLGEQEAEATACRVLEGNAMALGAQNAVDVVTVVEFVVEAFGDLDALRRVTVLHYYEVVRLKERSPLLQELQVPYCGDNYVHLLLQNRRRSCFRHTSPINHNVVSRMERWSLFPMLWSSWGFCRTIKFILYKRKYL